MAKEEGRAIIHAFDDPQVISGQGTIGLELLEDLPDLDQIYIPIGGGGLAAGVAIAIKAKKPNVKIIGVESKAFPAMKQSLKRLFTEYKIRIYYCRWYFSKISWQTDI